MLWFFRIAWSRVHIPNPTCKFFLIFLIKKKTPAQHLFNLCNSWEVIIFAFLICCCFSSILLLLLLFQIATSSLSCFYRCGRNKHSKFNFFRLDLKVRGFFCPNVYLLMGCYSFWLSMFFWVILIDKVLFVVGRNYLDIVHLILHIAFHCTFALCIFLAHCIYI